MTDPRNVTLDVLPSDGPQDRGPSILRRVLVAIVRFAFSANGAQVAGAGLTGYGAYLLLPLAIWLVVVGVALAVLGGLREAGRI